MIYGVILNDAASLRNIGALDRSPYNGAPKAPVMYIKPPNTVVGDGARISLPPGAGQVEIGATVGIVFAREAARVAQHAVHDVIAGYVVAADLSLPHASYYRPAVREKCFDGACPVSARIVPAAQAGALETVTLRTFIDDDEAGRRTLNDCVRDARTLVAEISSFMTFRRGDILLMGVTWQAAQAGIGARVRVEADRLGAVHFSIAAATPVAQATSATSTTREAR